MKTTICGICGRTERELKQFGAKLRHYKASRYSAIFNSTNIEEFNLCDECLKFIKDSMKKGGAE